MKGSRLAKLQLSITICISEANLPIIFIVKLEVIVKFIVGPFLLVIGKVVGFFLFQRDDTGSFHLFQLIQ